MGGWGGANKGHRGNMSEGEKCGELTQQRALIDSVYVQIVCCKGVGPGKPVLVGLGG